MVENRGRGSGAVRDAHDRERRLARACFCAAVALYLYGTLFPFRFDFAPAHLARAWSEVHFLPFWDPSRGRIHSIPDLVSNVLLTVPIGFFGFVLRSTAGSRGGVLRWGLFAAALAVIVEALQLALPQRGSSLTDVLTGAIGAVAGALVARLLGRLLTALVSGSATGPAHTWLAILLFSLVVTKLGPLDLTLDVGSIRADLKRLVVDPWNQGPALLVEWYTMAEFVLLGALVGGLVRRRDPLWGISPWRAAGIVLVLPFVLEGAQLFVHSHAPSLSDALLDFSSALAGLATGLLFPGFLRPWVGSAILTAALLAAGLSPYRFVPWRAHSSFEWIPLVEYYRKTDTGALYDAGLGILFYGLLGALVARSVRWSPAAVAVLSAALATVIEAFQMVVAGRSSGTTDILIAGLGGWLGAFVSRSPHDESDRVTAP